MKTKKKKERRIDSILNIKLTSMNTSAESIMYDSSYERNNKYKYKKKKTYFIIKM